jgi:hypothetical protein
MVPSHSFSSKPPRTRSQAQTQLDPLQKRFLISAVLTELGEGINLIQVCVQPATAIGANQQIGADANLCDKRRRQTLAANRARIVVVGVGLVHVDNSHSTVSFCSAFIFSLCLTSALTFCSDLRSLGVDAQNTVPPPGRQMA